MPSASVSDAGPVGVEGTGDDARAGAGDAEAGALLVDEVDDAERHVGLDAALRAARRRWRAR